MARFRNMVVGGGGGNGAGEGPQGATPANLPANINSHKTSPAPKPISQFHPTHGNSLICSIHFLFLSSNFSFIILIIPTSILN